MKTGWILEDMKETRDGRWFVTPLLSCGVTKDLTEVEVHDTRKLAREASNKISTDVVRKVEVNEKGKAVKIIPGR